MSLHVEEKKSVIYVTLNRPEVKNAINEEMRMELHRVFSDVSLRIRAIVLRGAGDFFSAGGDINWMQSSLQKSAQENELDMLKFAQMLRAIDECPAVVISQVKGGAFGGGLGLMAASDIVISDEKAIFSISEVKLGLAPATIAPLILRKIGVSEARRFFLTGKRFSSQVALRLHLVHESVPASSLLSVTNDYLNELSSSGPEAVRVAKRLIREMMAKTLWQEDICEENSRMIARMRVDKEAQEGMKAFLDKRTPSWKQLLI